MVIEKREQARRLYEHDGLSPSEIAKQLDIAAGKVRQWKKRYNWDGESCNVTDNGTKLKRHARVRKKITGIIEVAELTEREKNFCVTYISTWNATQAAHKAGYTGTPGTVRSTAYTLLQRADIKEYIRQLKAIRREAILADGDDLLDLARRVVFADITEAAAFDRHTVLLRDSGTVDGQIIRKVGAGKYGPTIELKDAGPYLALLTRQLGLDQTEADKDALAKVTELLAGFDEEACDVENDA